MRTQNVPMPVSTNGSATSAIPMSANPIHAVHGRCFRSRIGCMAR